MQKDKILIIPDTNVIHNPVQLALQSFFKELFYLCINADLADMGIVHTVSMEMKHHVEEIKNNLLRYRNFFNRNLSNLQDIEIINDFKDFLEQEGYENLITIPMYTEFKDIEKMPEHAIITQEKKGNHINDYFIFQSIKYFNDNIKYEAVYFLTEDNGYLDNKDKLEKEFNDYNLHNSCKLVIMSAKEHKDRNKILTDLEIENRLIDNFLNEEKDIRITRNELVAKLTKYQIKLKSENIDKLIKSFKDSNSYDRAVSLYYALISIIPLSNYTQSHIKDIIMAYLYNNQIYESYSIIIKEYAKRNKMVVFKEIDTIFNKIKFNSEHIYDIIIQCCIYNSFTQIETLLPMLKNMSKDIKFSTQQEEILTEKYKNMHYSKQDRTNFSKVVKYFDDSIDLSKIEIIDPPI